MAEETSHDWPKFSEFDGKKLLKELLESTYVGTLATSGRNGIWTATVFFAFDESFNIYFVSHRSTRHITNIVSNNRVAFSAFMPPEKSNGVHIGMQLEGEAMPVKPGDRQKAYIDRERRLNADVTWIPDKDGAAKMEAMGAMFFMIKPSALYYVNSSLFDSQKKLIKLD